MECQWRVSWGQDLLAQTQQVLANLKEVLRYAGATPADVVRLRTYVVNHSPANLAAICAQIGAFMRAQTLRQIHLLVYRH